MYLIFAPVLLVALAIIILGALFVQGYNVGNAMPRLPVNDAFADSPEATPSIAAIEIVDATDLPTNMPDVPTPARQITTHSMKHKETPTPQPARPLQPIAEAATSATTPVNDAVHQAINQVNPEQIPTGTPTPPPADTTPVPEVPAPNTPPLAQ